MDTIKIIKMKTQKDSIVCSIYTDRVDKKPFEIVQRVYTF